MRTELNESVIAVPPLARHADLSLNVAANTALIRHLEQGGISTLMYGGNANLYNVAPSDYPKLLDMLLDAAAPDTWLIPSVGPDYGKMADQWAALRARPFPTAMVLPSGGAFTAAGVADGIRRFVDGFGKPAIAYVRAANFLAPEMLARLVDEKAVTAIKYAIVREDPAEDAFLTELVKLVDRARIISGLGERPAISHWKNFGIRAFTSGSVSIAPRVSTALLEALKAGDFAKAEQIRAHFLPFETLRDTINPIQVLHDGVSLAGVADMGPILPLMSNLDATTKERVAPAARDLLRLNETMSVGKAA
ncbi:MAG TPA: dihydrodipicolinate synthase family protein [Dongiaceae bacterium]|nr:dihydrodipicolinate synthase family protein [Dongiaceae bacterium]